MCGLNEKYNNNRLYKQCTYKDQSNTACFIVYSKRRHVSAFRKPSSGLQLTFWLVVYYNARVNGIPYNTCKVHIAAVYVLTIWFSILILLFKFCIFSAYTGHFIMFCMITNIYNKKTKGPTLMELSTATGKLTKFFFTTRDVRCVCHGWHGTHRTSLVVKKNVFSFSVAVNNSIE
jgi:hypothetical protein